MDVVTLAAAKAATPKIISSKRATTPRLVGVGDSLVANNAGGPVQQVATRSNGRAVYGGYYATAGFTAAQILATHVPAVLALTGNAKPAACAILAGTNDAGANSGVGFSLPAFATTYGQITQALTLAGILPILCTVPPRGDLTAANTNAQNINAYLRRLASVNGWPLLDYHAQVVDPLTAGYKSGVSGDGIHPNLAGGYRVMTAGVVADLIAVLPLGKVPLTYSYGDLANLIAGSAQVFKTDGNADGVADGWSNFSGGSGQVFTVESDAAIAGQWQCLAKPPAATTNAYLQLTTSVTAGFSVGDKISFAALVQVLNLEASSTAATPQTATAGVNFRNAGNTVISRLNALDSWQADLTTTGTIYGEMLVPATCTKMDVFFQVAGTASASTGTKLRVAQPTLANLTALGLA